MVLTIVEYIAVIVGGMTVRVCKGTDTLGCAEVVDVKLSAVKVLVSVLDVEILGGVVVLAVEVFENVAGSVLVVPGSTLMVFGVVSVVPLVTKDSREGRVLILVSNLAEVGDISVLRATEEFVLMDSDGVTVVFRVVLIVLIVILGVKTLVVATVMVLGVEVSNLGGNRDVFIESPTTGMVEVVLGVDNRAELCVVTVVEAVLLGSGGKDFVWLIVAL